MELMIVKPVTEGHGMSMFIGRFEETYEKALSDILHNNAQWVVIVVNNKINLYSVSDFYKHFKPFKQYTWLMYYGGFMTKQHGMEFIYKKSIILLNRIYDSSNRFIMERQISVSDEFKQQNVIVRRSINGEINKYQYKLKKLYDRFPELLY